MSTLYDQQITQLQQQLAASQEAHATTRLMLAAKDLIVQKGGLFCEGLGYVGELTEQAGREIKEARKAAEAAIEQDRAELADWLTGFDRVIASRYWLTEGRGSYEWNDERYQDEFRQAVVEIKSSLEPLRRVAQDWSNSPKTSAEVIAARVDLKARIAELERERWTCFHCGFETHDRKEAAAHFGERAEEDQPICLTWAELNADQRVGEYQSAQKQLSAEREESARLCSVEEGLEYRLREYEDLTYSRFKVRSINDAYNKYDSMEGRALAAEEQRDAAQAHTQQLVEALQLLKSDYADSESCYCGQIVQGCDGDGTPRGICGFCKSQVILDTPSSQAALQRIERAQRIEEALPQIRTLVAHLIKHGYGVNDVVDLEALRDALEEGKG